MSTKIFNEQCSLINKVHGYRSLADFKLQFDDGHYFIYEIMVKGGPVFFSRRSLYAFRAAGTLLDGLRSEMNAYLIVDKCLFRRA